MNIVEAMKKVKETQGVALRESDKSVSLKDGGGNLLHSRDILADDWKVVE